MLLFSACLDWLVFCVTSIPVSVEQMAWRNIETPRLCVDALLENSEEGFLPDLAMPNLQH